MDMAWQEYGQCGCAGVAASGLNAAGVIADGVVADVQGLRIRSNIQTNEPGNP